MSNILSPFTISLLISIVGAITGVISLCWHIFNARPKIVLDRVSFVRESNHNRTEREVIGVSINIRNIGNRSTTIEDIHLEIGNNIIPFIFFTHPFIKSNSSEKLHFYQNFTPKEFKELLKEKKVRLGVTIFHTFGILKKYGWTDFATDYFNL